MRRPTNFILHCLYCLFLLCLALAIAPRILFAHYPGHDENYKSHKGHTHYHQKKGMPKMTKTISSVVALADTKATAAEAKSIPGVSGQGNLRFKVLYTRDILPPEAVKVLERAHGGFAVDRGAGKGEIYFALPGAGIIQISADLKSTRLIATPPEMKNANSHNATVWYASDGTPYISSAANDIGKVFTTTLDGKLVNTLDTPKPEDDFDQPQANDYFGKGGKFVPTDVEHLVDLFYVTTGYSDLDYVLTAKILTTKPFVAKWYDLAFGGRGNALGQFGTGHGITVVPGGKRLDVSDRANAKVERFTRYGHHRNTIFLPKGSFPCDIDYEGGYAVIGSLFGPDRSQGAPIYILKDDKVVSTITPKEELGLEKFQHVHHAVLRVIKGKLYIIAQAWNPGDFAILEQVTE